MVAGRKWWAVSLSEMSGVFTEREREEQAGNGLA
jgi:hypothetical protein